MTNDEIKQLAKETARATVAELKAAGMLQPVTAKTAAQKTEELLRQYPQLKGLQEPYARRVVQEIDALREATAREPYADVIRLYYFEGLSNVACANALFCDERTARRYRRQLVDRFSARLASDEFISELLNVKEK